MRVVLDTNVLVSASLTQQIEAPPYRVVAAVLEGVVEGVVSAALAEEYRAVLQRREVRDRSQLSQHEVDELLAALVSAGTIIEATPSSLAAPDPTDQHLWDLLDEAEDAVLVTGDASLLRSRHFPGRVFSPRDFVDRYLASA